MNVDIRWCAVNELLLNYGSRNCFVHKQKFCPYFWRILSPYLGNPIKYCLIQNLKTKSKIWPCNSVSNVENVDVFKVDKLIWSIIIRKKRFISYLIWFWDGLEASSVSIWCGTCMHIKRWEGFTNLISMYSENFIYIVFL